MKVNAKIMTILVLLTSTIHVSAHCQIPCGIYDDQMRINLIEEHITTIEKSMKEITTGTDKNQSVRWVLNKEQHADEISEIVTAYFMTQRIKVGCENYDQKIAALHELLIYSMKAKQSTDLKNVEKLKELTHHFAHLYMGEEHKH